MDNEEIIRALEEELTDIERRVSRDEKEVDIIESKEKRKADLKQKIKNLFHLNNWFNSDHFLREFLVTSN